MIASDFAPSAEQLERYLRRIGLKECPSVDAKGLAAVHRHHVQSVSWENLDMQLGLLTGLDPEAAYRKIVEQRRGGWCYEMNGLLGAMLQALGFRVRRLTAGVMREAHGDFVIGNHLALLVELDEPWLADLGLGSGLIEPVRLRVGTIEQVGRRFRLEQIEDGWWRFHSPPGSMPPSFDFDPGLSDEALLAERCHWLQTDPESPFCKTPVVQRYRNGQLHSLVRTTFVQHGPDGPSDLTITSEAQLREILEQIFELEIDQVGELWSICQAQSA